jgi:hypothetical protein
VRRANLFVSRVTGIQQTGILILKLPGFVPLPPAALTCRVLLFLLLAAGLFCGSI